MNLIDTDKFTKRKYPFERNLPEEQAQNKSNNEGNDDKSVFVPGTFVTAQGKVFISNKHLVIYMNNFENNLKPWNNIYEAIDENYSK